MIPKPPPREGQIGFLYQPPFRIQGTSVAGEATTVMVPELDVCFDMGLPLRCALPSKTVAVSHGHMDHIGGLAYFASQRQFQGMGTATIVCDARIVDDVDTMMRGFHDLERQRTPYTLIGLSPGEEHPVKNNMVLRGFETEHTCPSFGWAVVEKRSKLKPEFAGLPQEKLRELKERGTAITHLLEVPLVAYTGDTLPGPYLVADDVRKAQIVVSECTFFDPGHKDRAKVGMHLHVDDIAEWIGVLECEALVLTHISRRSHMNLVRTRLDDVIPKEHRGRVHVLMDHRMCRERYEKQVLESEQLSPG
ncbi:MAG TPA: MBL fold metallo-hydrolase [Phycisphaerales bacterium]|nr:MBL fold metallo-hydrolase [Phycisphaerales bacterium]